MKKLFFIVSLTFFLASVSAKTVTFETGETRQISINNEQVSLELTGVNPVSDQEGLYSAAFTTEDTTLTITSWNYFNQSNRLPSQINGEYVGLMQWNGEDTSDTNTDDTATLAWGNAYFPCEETQTGENEKKWCSDDITKQWEVGGETVNYNFKYVRETIDAPQVKQAVFTNEQGRTVTISSQNAPQYGYVQDQINGRTVYAKVVRGAGTDRGSDDAVILKKEEKTTCTYYFQGSVERGKEEARVYIGDGFTVLTNQKNFGLTKTGPCGGEIQVRYEENGETVTSKTVQLPEQNADVQVNLEAPKTRCTYDFTGTVERGEQGAKVHVNGGFTTLAQDSSFGFTKTARCGSQVNVSYSEDGETLASRTVQVPEQNSEVQVDLLAPPNYNVRSAANVKNLVGGAVPNVTPHTKINFGNTLQNTLYIHEINGSYMREVSVTMSAGERDAERFTLNWDNMVTGETTQYNSGRYTVHLCGDTSPDNLKISISKQEGMNGYGACFREKVADEGSFQTVNYQIGGVAEVNEGDVLRFGPNNLNALYINNIDYLQNLDTRQAEFYANRLREYKNIPIVKGGSTEAYFYSGRYPVHFCSFQNDQARVVISDQGVGSSQACQQEVESPSGTVNLDSERYPSNTQITATADISEQGSYRLKAFINGDRFVNTGIESTAQTDIQITPPATGNLTVKLVAPGSWWNPLDSTRLISTDNAQVYTPESEEPTCDQMVSNAQEHSDSSNSCAQVTANMVCGNGEINYTAQNSCEISYLQERGWETSGTGSNSSQASIAIPDRNVTKGATLNLTVQGGSGNNLVIEGPQTDQTYSVESTAQVFNIDTSQLPVGQYTAKVLPPSQDGFMGVIGDLIGGPIDSKTFQVKEPSTWKNYCSSNGYSPETVDGQISCIQNQIVPECFSQNPGQQCRRVAEDVCQELLGYSFNSTAGKCQAPQG